MIIVNKKTGQRKEIKGKYIPKRDYACEISVSDQIDLGENQFPSPKRNEKDRLIFNPEKEIKFHDVDNSIELLFQDMHNEGVLKFGLA